MAINLKQNADMSGGLAGTDAGDGEFIYVHLPYSTLDNTTGEFLTVTGPTFSRRMIVKAITGCAETVATNSVTATVYRAPSGTAVGSGTALHSGTFDLKSTAATPVALTLAAASALDLPAGTRIGAVVSGAMGAAGVGSITVALAPA